MKARGIVITRAASRAGLAGGARRSLRGLLPHTVQLCIHCRQNPAGFWVSGKDAQTVHRPWCLSCCDGLDRSRCRHRVRQVRRQTDSGHLAASAGQGITLCLLTHRPTRAGRRARSRPPLPPRVLRRKATATDGSGPT